MKTKIANNNETIVINDSGVIFIINLGKIVYVKIRFNHDIIVIMINGIMNLYDLNIEILKKLFNIFLYLSLLLIKYLKMGVV